MPVNEVKTLEEFHEVINGDQPVIFDFWATWCGPCKIISPIFAKFSDEFPALKFYKVDIEADAEAEKISQEVGVRAMPVFMVFKKGQKIGDVLGARPLQLKELIQKHSTPPSEDAPANVA